MWQTTRSGESGGNRAARLQHRTVGAARSGRSRVAAATAIGAGAIALSLVAGGAPAIADPAAPAPAPAPADPAKQTPTPAKPPHSGQDHREAGAGDHPAAQACAETGTRGQP